jgi:hypothetical protein
MSFNRKEGKPIPLGQAVKWVKTYQKKNPKLPKGYFFGKEVIEQLLKESGCMGIRIYMGEDDNGVLHPVLVGARADQSNILPKNLAATESTGGAPQVINDSKQCPPECPPEDDPLSF